MAAREGQGTQLSSDDGKPNANLGYPATAQNRLVTGIL